MKKNRGCYEARCEEERSHELRVKRLEALYEKKLEQLFNGPYDEKLSREIRNIEVDIVRLKGERIMDYNVDYLNYKL
jgi:hypothetical protein